MDKIYTFFFKGKSEQIPQYEEYTLKCIFRLIKTFPALLCVFLPI